MKTISIEELDSVCGGLNPTQLAHRSAVNNAISNKWGSQGVVSFGKETINSNGNVRGTFTVNPLWGGDPLHRTFTGHVNSGGAHFSSMPR